MMSPLAHTLLCAIRYAHGRSLHPYEEVVAAVREVWPQLDPASRRYWLDLVEAQVPADLTRMIEAHTGGSLPVSREELEVELQHYLHLFQWCRENLALGTPEALLARHIDALDLSNRAINALEGAGIRFVDHLTQQTEADLLRLRGLGTTSLEEIKRALGRVGLSLGTKLPVSP